MEQMKITDESKAATQIWSVVVKATGEAPIFKAGDRGRILMRFPIGHFRVPNYIRGKHGIVESVIEPAAVNNEEEGYGRNAKKNAIITGLRFRSRKYGKVTRVRRMTICESRFSRPGWKEKELKKGVKYEYTRSRSHAD